MKDKNIVYFLIFTLIFCLSSFIYIFFGGIKQKAITSDAQGYYAYLPAFLIYKDYDMDKSDIYHPESGSLEFPAIYLNPNTGKHMSKYPIGVSVLLLPFFILAHILALVFNFPQTGFSLIYQYVVGLAGLFYLNMGLVFLYKAYNFYYSKKATLVTLFSLVFATNLLHYATFESLMSHVFSLFLISVFLFMLKKWHKQNSVKNSILLGILVGLIFLVRNLNILVLFLLLGYINKKNVKRITYIVVSFLIIILPQLIYWKFAAGQPLLYSYAGEGFNFLDPRVKGFLLSYRRGLLFWSPIFVLLVFGLKGLKQKLGNFSYAIFLFLGIFVFITSSWKEWAYGSGFGNRALIDIYPILGIILANFFEKLNSNLRLRQAGYILVVLFIVLNLTNMIKYWHGVLPPDHVTLELYLKNIYKFK
ncbi:hypothetical protein ACFLZ1_04425 [Patescibacteria group bacterium]